MVGYEMDGLALAHNFDLLEHHAEKKAVKMKAIPLSRPFLHAHLCNIHLIPFIWPQRGCKIALWKQLNFMSRASPAR